MINNISSNKFDFIMNQLLNDIDLIKSYTSSKYDTIGDFYYFSIRSLSYEFNLKYGSLSKIVINGSVKLEYNLNNQDKKNEITSKVLEKFFNRIIDIEEEEFKRLYPNYDSTLESRDSKLKDLLGSTVIIDQKKKKKWW